jgi:uncharacterized protein (TIGR03435 family)
MTRWCAALGLFLSAVTIGQPADPLPEFQAADIHGSAKTTNPFMRGGVVRAGRFEVRTASMLELLSYAYDFETDRVVGGPVWLPSDRFDIVASAPAGTSQDKARLMTQSLLAERFKLEVHKDTRPMPAFVLSVGKAKPKIKASDGKSPPGCQRTQGTAQAGTGAFVEVSCHNMTMAALADRVRGFASEYLPNPVIDATGLTGVWDFDLKWNPRNQLAGAGPDGLTIFSAVEKQLGLMLEPQTRPQTVLVVDKVNRNPSPNAPDVVAKLPPPPPAEFEVATIKRSMPDAPPRGNVRNGRVDLDGMTLKQLIMIAWDTNNDQLVAGLPKSAESTRFTVTAKAAIPEGANAQEVDELGLRLMLRSLIQERFNLKSHSEDRPIEGYVLSAVKPKLEKADASNRTECKEGPGKDGKDPRNTNPILNRLLTCTNMTMGQFAEQLPLLVNGYVRTQVLDSTQLEGPWDFTLSFSGVNLFRASTADNPNGALSISDAVSKQLGLKLELQKRPMSVLVIDHVDENPTDN